MKPSRIALYGERGAGKSTTGRLIAEILGPECLIVRSAAPLYRLQQAVYAEAGRMIGADQQDEVVLSSLATAIRSVNRSALADAVVRTADSISSHDSDIRLVLCDDSRPVDRRYLDRGDFSFACVMATESTRALRLASRGDVDPHRPTPDQAPYRDGDFKIVNDGTLTQLRDTVSAFLSERGLL